MRNKDDGYKTYPIYASKEEYLSYMKNLTFIRDVKDKIERMKLDFDKAKMLNQYLELQIEEPE